MTTSSTPDFWTICRFSSWTSAMSSSVSRPSSTIDRANAFSASNAVSPSAALASRSAPAGPSSTFSAPAAVLRAIIPSSVARICGSVGSGKSTRVTSDSSSGGICGVGEIRISVRGTGPSL